MAKDEERERRLAAALRENLRKRKMRERDEGKEEEPNPPSSPRP